MSEEFVSVSLFNEYKNVVNIQRELIEADQKRNNERLKHLESETNKINELTNSIAVMAIGVENLAKEIQNQRDDLNKLMSDINKRVENNEKDISEIKNAPVRTWSNIKTLVMTGSVGAVVSAVMAYIIQMVHITH